MLGHQNSLLENNPKAHFHFSAETTPTQDVVIYSDPLDFITTILDPPYKDPYVDMGIEQRAREMTQAEPRIFISVHLYRNICLKTQKYLLIKIKSSMWPTCCPHETQMLANTNELQLDFIFHIVNVAHSCVTIFVIITLHPVSVVETLS